jgi:hypothetical protein
VGGGIVPATRTWRQSAAHGPSLDLLHLVFLARPCGSVKVAQRQFCPVQCLPAGQGASLDKRIPSVECQGAAVRASHCETEI